MRISEYISYNEGVYSSTAIRKGIDNVPNNEQLNNMRLVAEKCFEPVRKYLGVPIKINSFFRSVKLNTSIGGSKTSEHCKGMAIDMSCENANKLIFYYIKNNLDFTQLIWEFGNNDEPAWVHVSYDKNNLKKQVLKAISKNRKTVYVNY